MQLKFPTELQIELYICNTSEMNVIVNLYINVICLLSLIFKIVIVMKVGAGLE